MTTRRVCGAGRVPAGLSRADWPPTSRGIALLLLAAGALAAVTGLLGCAGSHGGAPGEPVAPPPQSAWRPGEALALLVKPPQTGVLPIDDDYLERTRHFRVRIQEAESMADSLHRVDKRDRGGQRTWFLSGPEAVLVRIGG